MANGDATNEGYNRTNKATDICEVHPSFFHIMQQTSGSTNNANINVYYDNTLDGNWDKVGYWNGNLWNNYTGSSTSSGSPLYYGSANNVNLSISTPIALTKNAPVLSITASSTSICEGDSTTLTASGASTYSWNTGDNTASITVTPSSTTTYTVTGTSGTCSATATITVTVNPLPTVTAEASINPVCSGQSTTLSAQGASTYSWSNGMSGQAINVIPNNTTTYSVTGSIGGCTDTATVSITVYPSPDATVYTTDETCIDAYDGSAWVVVEGGEPPYTYLWDTNGAFNEMDSVINLKPGEYSVTVTDSHNCSVVESVIIKPGTEYCYVIHVYVPNIFSPDGFGNEDNECLRVYGKGIETIDFTIFDRWGNEIFHTTDINEGWDGTYKGEPALVGDYTYFMKVVYVNGERESLKGHIYLIR